jgi:AcrR family transcriptional regulator
LSSNNLKKSTTRIPKQERSIQRFESVVAATLKLLSERSYESISMREIAREAEMPIASVYQYFPTKLAIVQELWERYANLVFNHLEADLQEVGADTDIGLLINRVVDLMVSVQQEQTAYNEVWACVAAAPELRDKNIQDTLRTSEVVTKAMVNMSPHTPSSNEREVLHSISLIMCESAGATTKLAMTLPEELRKQTIAQLKQALRWMYEGAIRQMNDDFR